MHLGSYLAPHGITLLGALSLADCPVRRPYLLERAGLDPDHPERLWVQIFAIPYLTPTALHPDANVSAYAVGRDYHAFAAALFEDIIPALLRDFPGHRFVGFADHSPIDEIEVAVSAGLGVRGDNRLLLTELYSSFVFLGEIITDLPLDPTPSPLPPERRHCERCGNCRAACPLREGEPCRSALTQKKGNLSAAEQAMLGAHSLVWGCDACQLTCPYTVRALAHGTIWTPIPYFQEYLLPRLTLETLDAMSDREFSCRAYAWRGRDTIRRNLLLRTSSHSDHKEVTPCCN